METNFSIYIQGFPTQVATKKMGYAEVTMTVISAVEESRIRNLVKFVATVHTYRNCSDVA